MVDHPWPPPVLSRCQLCCLPYAVARMIAVQAPCFSARHALDGKGSFSLQKSGGGSRASGHAAIFPLGATGLLFNSYCQTGGLASPGGLGFPSQCKWPKAFEEEGWGLSGPDWEFFTPGTTVNERGPSISRSRRERKRKLRMARLQTQRQRLPLEEAGEQWHQMASSATWSAVPYWCWQSNAGFSSRASHGGPGYQGGRPAQRILLGIPIPG